MLSLFPGLLSFGLLAPFILRLVVGFFFAFEAWELIARARHVNSQKQVSANAGTHSNVAENTKDVHPDEELPIADAPLSPLIAPVAVTEQSYTNPWIRLFAIAQFVTGGLLVIGAFTQAAALSAMLLTFFMLRTTPHPLYAPHERLVYKLLFFISLTLLFLGAGAFGFDFPL